jgi:DNA-binding transcriptional LysR family regulator
VVTVLYSEARVLLVPAAHRLAGKAAVTADDIAAEPLVGCTGMGVEWTTFWRLEPRSDGEPAAVGPTLAETYEDKLEAIADGTAIAIVPAGDQRYALRPDLVTVALEGIEPCQVVVAARAADPNPLVTEFVRSALTVTERGRVDRLEIEP